MFGAYRFFLASLVVLTHSGMHFGSFRPGPMAVICFYIISGYVISALLDNRAARITPGGFYLERSFRIYPQFAAHLLISVVFLLATGHVSKLTEIRPDFVSVLTNASLFPLQFRAFSDDLSAMLYVPTSWSLSLEASFYVAAPFLLRSRFQDVFGWLSLAVFAAAVLNLLPGPPHTLSYATIFGTLHFFLLGTWIQRGETRKVGAWCALMIGIAIAVTLFASWRPAHIEEAIFGGLSGAAAIYLLKNARNARLKHLDDWLGRISYPVFLNHFLFIWSFELLGRDTLSNSDRCLVLAGSWIFGLICYWAVEHPTHAFRRSLRTMGQRAALAREGGGPA